MSTNERQLKHLTIEQKTFFDEQGYLHLPAFYDPNRVDRLRREFHEMIRRADHGHKTITHALYDRADGFQVDAFNPRNVQGMMNHVAFSDSWFDHMTDPYVVMVMAALFGPDIDFHNGKVRNKPLGFTCEQGWHQDFPYERHSSLDLPLSARRSHSCSMGASASASSSRLARHFRRRGASL